MAVLLLLTAALSIGGVELATPDGTGYAQGFDAWVASLLAADRVGAFLGVARASSLVGGALGIVAISVAAGLWLVRRTGRRWLGFAPLTSLAVVQVVVQSTKVVVGRPRPGANLGAVMAGGFAFPSGHAAAATAVAVTVGLLAARALGWRATPRWLVPALAGITLTIAGSRIIVGAHWASDVLAGITAGAVVAVVVSGLFIRGRAWPRPQWLARVPRLLSVGVIVALVPIGASYVRALHAPGQAATSVRTVEWLRSGGLSGPVDMTVGADRYLAPDQRDFVAVFTR